MSPSFIFFWLLFFVFLFIFNNFGCKCMTFVTRLLFRKNSANLIATLSTGKYVYATKGRATLRLLFSASLLLAPQNHSSHATVFPTQKRALNNFKGYLTKYYRVLKKSNRDLTATKSALKTGM